MPINIGFGDDVTIGDLAEMVIAGRIYRLRTMLQLA